MRKIVLAAITVISFSSSAMTSIELEQELTGNLIDMGYSHIDARDAIYIGIVRDAMYISGYECDEALSDKLISKAIKEKRKAKSLGHHKAAKLAILKTGICKDR